MSCGGWRASARVIRRPTSRTKETTVTTDAEAVAVAQAPARQASEDTSIRPFTVHVPEAKLQDLRRRIAATQWPEKETVADDSQGVPLALMQDVSRYWATEYDWRKVEATLNALPQFITEIDGLDIHFIHVRSKHANALPVIVTHGWPGSIIHQLKIIDPLVNPTAHGGSEPVSTRGSHCSARERIKSKSLRAHAVHTPIRKRLILKMNHSDPSWAHNTIDAISYSFVCCFWR
jgi:hypothetical protein